MDSPSVIGDSPLTQHFSSRSHVLLLTLFVLTAIRLFVAAAAPLSPDEAYYWVWSRALAAGYLDHPFMVALWIRLGTWIGGDTPWGVRLLAPLAAAGGSLLLVEAADGLFPLRRPGLQAALLLNATLLFGVGAVTMTPDTPLLFFWTVAVWALARLATGAAKPCWLLVGAASGLALDSKYTAALLGAGIALWLLTPPMRPHLRSPWPWLGGLLALVCFLPVLFWNAAHGWVSFAKQGSRTGDWDSSRALRFIGELLAGQAGLATPVIAVLFVLGTVAAARRWRSPSGGLVAVLVLPGAAVFLQHAVGDRVQANWVAIVYPGAALAAAGFTRRGWAPAAALGLVLTALLYLQATWSPVPLPRRLDPTLRTAGWDQVTAQAERFAHQDGAAFLASEEYGVASLLAWSARDVPVIAASPRWSLFTLPRPAMTGTGLLLISARRREPPDPALWRTASPAGTLLRERSGVEIEAFRLYRVTPQPGAPAVLLPTRHGPSEAARNAR